MKSKIYEAKSIEEVKKLAVEELGIPESEIDFNVVSEKKGFLGLGGKIEVEAVCNVDGANKGKEYLEMILKHNGFEGMIEKKVRDDVISLNIDAGDDNKHLIGKNSYTLVALQTLVQAIVNRYDDRTVVVDVNGYKKKRVAHLERMAVEYGKQVSRTKQVIKLSNLNAYERKIMHNKLSTWNDVATHSEGEEPNRCLIIEPKK